MSDTNLIDFDALMKKGARNSKDDHSRIQAVHDHAAGLGALCLPGNCPAEEGGDEDTTPGRPSSKRENAAAVKKDGESALDEVVKAVLPLDVQVQAVRDAFWDLRTASRLSQKPEGISEHDYWDWDDDLCPNCVAVYDTYAIARIGLTHYKVPYSVGDVDIELAEQDAWEAVTQDWVTKNVPTSVLKAFQFREVGSVKALGGNRLGNYLVVWGDEDKRDLYGEYFTQETKGLKAIFDYIGKVPALYQHAMDGQVKYTPVGVVDTMEIDEVGLWTETQLDIANQYASAVQRLARKKALGASSGTLPGARKVSADGEIKEWVIIEGSFTPTPAEPRLRELSVSEVKAIYAELNLELPSEVPEVKAATGDEESQSDASKEIELEREKLRLLALL